MIEDVDDDYNVDAVAETLTDAQIFGTNETRKPRSRVPYVPNLGSANSATPAKPPLLIA